MLFLEPPGYNRSAIDAIYETLGIRHDVLDAAELSRRFPALDSGRYFPPRLPDDEHFFDDADGHVTATWTPEAGFVDDPQLAAANLMAAAVRDGTTVRLRTEVVGVLIDRGRVGRPRTGGRRAARVSDRRQRRRTVELTAEPSRRRRTRHADDHSVASPGDPRGARTLRLRL
jgi:glycine/D-amino acid oxidase-like deaminating enzyme